MQMNSKAKGFAAGILAAVFYGTNPLGTLYLYQDGITSSSVLFYRYALAVAMFALWMVVKGEDFRNKLGHAIRFAVLGAFFAMSSVTLYLSFHHMDAGIASTILFCYPIMTAVLVVAFMAVTGIGLLYRGDGSGTLSPVGISLVLQSSLLYAFYIIGVNRFQTSYSSLKFTFWIVLFGLLCILAFTWISGDTLQLLTTVPQWVNALQLALLPTVLSLFCMTIAIKNIGSTPAAIMGALEPVTAVVIGVCVFAESFSFRLGVGIFLILSAVIVLILSKKNQRLT